MPQKRFIIKKCHGFALADFLVCPGENPLHLQKLSVVCDLLKINWQLFVNQKCKALPNFCFSSVTIRCLFMPFSILFWTAGHTEQNTSTDIITFYSLPND